MSVTFLGGSTGNKLGNAGTAIQNDHEIHCPANWHLVDQNHDGVLVCQPN